MRSKIHKNYIYIGKGCLREKAAAVNPETPRSGRIVDSSIKTEFNNNNILLLTCEDLIL
jgi:hypothetical protein